MNPDHTQATEQIRGLFYGTPYRLIRPLGEGGMGAVFLVEHVELGRECVAKVLHARFAGDAHLIDRMRIEAQSLGRLHHPNVVQITGFGTTHDGRPFLVMEWLQGRPLSDELEVRGQIPPKEALPLAVQLLSGLSAAHAIGLVHRDIKPDNLFLCDEPTGGCTLKVLDFGVARVLPNAPEGAPDPLVIPTGTGMVVGTPRYVSPEGATGKRVDARADIYAAALVLYNMLAGRGPFDHLHGDALLAAHAFQNAEPPSRYARTRIPESLDAAIQKALSKSPEHRFQSALEFKSELERIIRVVFQPVTFEGTDFEAMDFYGADLRANAATDSFDPRLVQLPEAPLATPTPRPQEPVPARASALAPPLVPTQPSEARHERAIAAAAPPTVATTPHMAAVVAVAALTALVVASLVALAVTALVRGFK